MANYSMNTIEMIGIGKENLFKKQKDFNGNEVLEFDLACMNIKLDDFEENIVSHTQISDDSISFNMYRDAKLPKEFLEAFSKKYNEKKVIYTYAPECDWLTKYVYEFLNGKLIKEYKGESDISIAMDEGFGGKRDVDEK